MLKIGVVGLGTVGSALVDILQKNASLIEMRAGKKIEVIKACVRDTNKKRNTNIAITNDVEQIINDPQIDVVVELMGGVEQAHDVVSKALRANKHVVTANKALLAYHRYELSQLASEKTLAYEASVAGGIPIIKALRDSMGANNIVSIKGIINGTCNYMLTRMSKNGASFEQALKEAQELGYAEADP
ncbi:MAG: homoserine dehydrogenase, partial [Deltaproteobacteria bacterium]